MPLWGTGYPGSNPVSALNFSDLRPGDDLTMLDGTETIVTGSLSIAFAPGYSVNGRGTKTFTLTGCPGGTVIDIQASNGVSSSGRNPPVTPTLANMNASFTNVSAAGGGGTITGNGFYTDIGSAAFYRAVVTTFVSNDVPVLIVDVK